MRDVVLDSRAIEAILAPRGTDPHSEHRHAEILELRVLVSTLRDVSGAVPAPRPTPTLAALLAGLAEPAAPAHRRRAWSRLAGWFSGLGFGAKVALGAVAATAAVGASGTAGVLAGHVQTLLHHSASTSHPGHKPATRHHPTAHPRRHTGGAAPGHGSVASPAGPRSHAAFKGDHPAAHGHSASGGPAVVGTPSSGDGAGPRPAPEGGTSTGTPHDGGTPGGSSDGSDGAGGPGAQQGSGGGSDGGTGGSGSGSQSGDTSGDGSGDNSGDGTGNASGDSGGETSGSQGENGASNRVETGGSNDSSGSTDLNGPGGGSGGTD